MRSLSATLALALTLAAGGARQGAADEADFAGLELRSLGPALTSGRISDLAVDGRRRHVFYVATASGGVWKTADAGITWTPLFDREGSSSIGCIALDPDNPHVVWVGTGENSSSRAVAYGDGVYKSLDGGRSWTRMGLERSEHIGRIVIDPRDSDVVWVAAVGPLWSAGGDRGLYKTTDGGRTWNAVLTVSENTGVTDVALDPRHPDIVYAAAHQRRRRPWTMIHGGPESALYKTTDGGKSWRKLTAGLPRGELGRIGLTVSPADPDVVYAVIEAAQGGGFYRSVDRGETWEKRSSYGSRFTFFFQELVADPRNVDRVYSDDVRIQASEDGGATFRPLPETHKHVDNHALWIDPGNTDYLLAGSDGGIYETYDRGRHWRFLANLPVTQFYRVSVDDAKPFYNVYAGAQDNNVLTGPSRTMSAHGITNRDWSVAVIGDGFSARVDPAEPDILYATWQYGHLVRFDRVSGEALAIRPEPPAGDEPLRWNWDAPLLTSAHHPNRLYFAANRLFRSDDRGHSWQAISGDLSRRLDRDRLPVMGKLWSVDAIGKNRATSQYGNVTCLAESPLVADLLYAGTDDGLVQVSEPEGRPDGGGVWRRVDAFPGVPEGTYVGSLVASHHDGGVVYAVFNAHKSGDFKPYVLKSADRGRTWRSIAGDLPERGSVYALAEDHVAPNLLFAGTEFGLFVTLDGGGRWDRLDGGLPTVMVRDLAIQRRDNDLVAATYGRGLYILDDYTPLRSLAAERLAGESILFPVRDAAIFNESFELGLAGKAFMGDSFYSAPNPPAGALVTYYLGQTIESRRDRRRAAELELAEKGEEIPQPSWEELAAEDAEDAPAILVTVSDADGHVIRRLSGEATAGFHRLAWDLRFPPPEPASLEPTSSLAWELPPIGPRVVPDTYRVTLSQRVDGVETPLSEPQTFAAFLLDNLTLPTADPGAVTAFQSKTARLQRALLGTLELIDDLDHRLDLVHRAADDTAGADSSLGARARRLASSLADLRRRLRGDPWKRRLGADAPPPVVERVSDLIYGHWLTLAPATRTQQDSYDDAATDFEDALTRLRRLIEDIGTLDADLEAAGAPWTPGRVPQWQRE